RSPIRMPCQPSSASSATSYTDHLACGPVGTPGGNAGGFFVACFPQDGVRTTQYLRPRARCGTEFQSNICRFTGLPACASNDGVGQRTYFATCICDMSHLSTCSGGTSAGILAAFQVRPVGVSCAPTQI